ncbi:MAG TPA: hypothetical protein VFN67_30090 [Polyangiales bacterium]|nr:hypothetical protein [Polyangiales bacterium]
MLQALDVVCAFTDAELVRGLQRLVKADRTLSAELLVHLGEVEARGLYREHAYSTMFDYCRSALGMSDAEAGLRVLAARVGRRFPLVVERLGMGALNLTAIKLLAPHLTADNHVQLLDRVSSMSKRDIEVLLADLAPKPDVPARIRKLPERRVAVRSAVATEHREGRNSSFTPAESNTTVMPATSGTVATTSGTGIADACSTAAADVCSTAAADGAGVAAINSTAAVTTSDTAVAATTAAILRQPSALNAGSRAVQPAAARVAANASSSTFALQPTRPRATSKPLGLGRFDVHLTLGQEAHTALEQLVELFRHQNPRGDFTTIIERALFELLKSTMKRRFGQTNSAQPQRTHQPANPRPNIDNKLTPHGRNNAKHHGRNNAENHRTNNAENHRSNNAENHRSNNAENHRTNNAENHRPNNAEHDVRNIEHGGQTTAVRANTERDRRTNTERDVRAVGATNVRAEARSADGRSTKSRYIPRAVLREVHARDMGQCTYVSPDGRRCSARGFLEVHHHNTAFARGGEATVENLRLVCRAHNLFFAERDYGRGLMQSKMREAAARKQLSLVPEQNQA